ncbi:MAG TPA: hypothetical protein PLZ93_09595 [Nocardioides sp.]|uniref:hypothetical protein n=1 Tax=uncultured Nocardioides sp. TaxID=198441 RepID=UPI000EBE03A2|nr:hypothetical protein [uncultured Nocardioides sp.]HCB03827.1 hypothetical protein [Nocardioides sp.]HRD62724.1 hypothetical protein [Nocardioides sp.]HRI95855.1 hypothetical protein [Nocardioides sp.]HRK45656.1 hypothetical protein [Nocardioides sp.]
MKRLTPILALAVLAPMAVLSAPAQASPARADVTSPATFTDASGDVANAKLDIQKVTVKNTAKKLVIRVAFPGNPRVFDFPTGNVSIFIDTDASRKGAEYGHFMEFWSDYRFAKVSKWREQPTPAWGHSPEGRCVDDAGLIHDKGHHMKWFQYIVKKRPGCFEAGAVRIAVSTMNTGDLDPYVEYSRPFLDHLGRKHQWTDWVSQG